MTLWHISSSQSGNSRVTLHLLPQPRVTLLHLAVELESCLAYAGPVHLGDAQEGGLVVVNAGADLARRLGAMLEANLSRMYWNVPSGGHENRWEACRGGAVTSETSGLRRGLEE